MSSTCSEYIVSKIYEFIPHTSNSIDELFEVCQNIVSHIPENFFDSINSSWADYSNIIDDSIHSFFQSISKSSDISDSYFKYSLNKIDNLRDDVEQISPVSSHRWQSLLICLHIVWDSFLKYIAYISDDSSNQFCSLTHNFNNWRNKISDCFNCCSDFFLMSI